MFNVFRKRKENKTASPMPAPADRLLAMRASGKLRPMIGVGGAASVAIPAGWATIPIPWDPTATPQPFVHLVFADGLVPKEIAQRLPLAIRLGDDPPPPPSLRTRIRNGIATALLGWIPFRPKIVMRGPNFIRTGGHGLAFAPITTPQELTMGGQWMLTMAKAGTLFPLDVLVPEEQFGNLIEAVRQFPAPAATDPKALPSR